MHNAPFCCLYCAILGFHFNMWTPKEKLSLSSPQIRQHLVLYYEHTLENPLKADDTDPKNLLTTTAWEVGEWGDIII